MSSKLWRGSFVVAGVSIILGGMNHPRGSMAEMLAHADWVWSHAVLLVGFAALLFGLSLYRRRVEPPSRTDRWVRWAMAGTALQVVEMAFHTAAAIDAGALAAGESTPILTVHLWLTVLLYPVFSATIVGLIWVGARQRTLGSMWIAWLGIAGAVAHAGAPILVLILGLPEFSILFPMVMLLALWMIIAAFWPVRAGAPDEAPAEAPA